MGDQIHAATEPKSPSFEREKWVSDNDFRQKELDIKSLELRISEEDLRFRAEEAKRSRWANPLVIAVLAAALAGLSNAGVTWLSGREQRRLEDFRASTAQTAQDRNNANQLTLESFKAESERILEVIKTNDPDKAAENLKFLIDSHLIEKKDTADYIRNFLATRTMGQGPALPTYASSFEGAGLAATSPVASVCDHLVETHKNDNPGLVRAVASTFGLPLAGRSDQILEHLLNSDWQKVADGPEAERLASTGYLVVAGLEGRQETIPENDGYVAIVVSGPLARAKYPTICTTSSSGAISGFTTANWLWSSHDVDRILYFAKLIPKASNNIVNTK